MLIEAAPVPLPELVMVPALFTAVVVIDIPGVRVLLLSLITTLPVPIIPPVIENNPVPLPLSVSLNSRFPEPTVI